MMFYFIPKPPAFQFLIIIPIGSSVAEGMKRPSRIRIRLGLFGLRSGSLFYAAAQPLVAWVKRKKPSVEVAAFLMPLLRQYILV